MRADKEVCEGQKVGGERDFYKSFQSFLVVFQYNLQNFEG